MRLYRFFVKFKINGDAVFVEDANFVNQVRNVLRMELGDSILLCDDGIDILSELESFDGNKVILKKIKESKNDSEPEKKITLYCSILKHDNFEVVAQKAVEVGATNIVPIVSARTVKTNVRLDRLEKIVKEAAEQSGRAIIPEVCGVMTFEEALTSAKSNDANIIFDVSSHDLPDKSDYGINLGIFIGPEGGWTEEEVERARINGFKVFSLGKLVLRAETAAIIATYIFAK